MKKILLLCVLLCFGCATTSFTFNKLMGHSTNPSDALTITDKEVDKKIEELSSTTPKDPEGIVYNENTDRYEIKSEIYNRALRDGIMYSILKEKVDNYIKNHKETTLGDALKTDLGTAGITILIIAILGVLSL